MSISKIINFICIIAGGLIAFYANAQEEQNMYVLLGGIMLLMFGVYRTSRNIPSKFDKEEESFIKTEKEDDV